MEIYLILMDIDMKVNGKMIWKMVLGFYIILMEIDMKVNLMHVQ